MLNERCDFGLAYIPLTKALLMLFWSRYLMKYPVQMYQYPSFEYGLFCYSPKLAKVNTAESNLNKKCLSSGDLSSESQI
jgi:hypothetical protein